MTARSDVHVSHHRLLIAEPGADGPSDFPNGLVAGGAGAAVILTGIHTGAVDVTVQLADAEPPAPTARWEEVEQTELITLTGEVGLSGLMGDAPAHFSNLTPQGPGRYGVRVHATGRRLDPTAVPRVPFEFYLVTIWPIDIGPEAARRYGAGVAQDLGLPSKSSAIREWAAKHGPETVPGRIAQPGKPFLPTASRGVAGARDHQFRVVNPYVEPVTVPPLPEGLVAAADDCVIIRTAVSCTSTRITRTTPQAS